MFYHGTNAAWTQYDLSKNVNQMYGEGIYLTADPKRARLYGDRVMPLYVKATTDFREAKKTGKRRDYTHVKTTGDIVVVSPEQIKSATNNIGTFDAANPDIRYSLPSTAEIEGRRERAIEAFGTTTDFNQAGFLMPDGQMLKLSQYGLSGVKHNRIEAAFEDAKGSEAVARFIAEGNVRVNASSPGIEIFADTEPTVSQLNMISRLVSRSRSKGRFFVDFSTYDI